MQTNPKEMWGLKKQTQQTKTAKFIRKRSHSASPKREAFELRRQLQHIDPAMDIAVAMGFTEEDFACLAEKSTTQEIIVDLSTVDDNTIKTNTTSEACEMQVDSEPTSVLIENTDDNQTDDVLETLKRMFALVEQTIVTESGEDELLFDGHTFKEWAKGKLEDYGLDFMKAKLHEAWAEITRNPFLAARQLTRVQLAKSLLRMLSFVTIMSGISGRPQMLAALALWSTSETDNNSIFSGGQKLIIGGIVLALFDYYWKTKEHHPDCDCDRCGMREEYAYKKVRIDHANETDVVEETRYKTKKPQASDRVFTRDDGRLVDNNTKIGRAHV